MRKAVNITGQKFGILTAVSLAFRKNNSVYWYFQCGCGNAHIAATNHVMGGRTRSCGCLRNQAASTRLRRHGEAYVKTRLYRIWKSMRRRCRSVNDPRYASYGGRGVKVDPVFDVFEGFRDWARAHGYADHLTIDRIDNNGDYTPLNMRWATLTEQARNRTDTHWVTHNGKKMAMSEAAEACGINYYKLRSRLGTQGLSFAEAISRP